MSRVGTKTPVSAPTAVCASQHPLVTDLMLDVMRSGGNAVDAAIAGCLLHATVQHEMTNHAGTVSFLYWEARSGRTYELNSMGTVPPGLAPFRPVPAGTGLYLSPPGPIALIPGFMPGLKAMYERFATRPWSELCEPAVHRAEEGHVVDSFEHLVTGLSADIYMHTASGRDHFTPEGHLPQVGDRWPKPELARTLRGLADEGPDYFIDGEWARAFLARANELGWPIELSHMSAMPPKWGEGTRYRHRDYEIVQLSPPERLGVFSAMVLGILDALDVRSLGHYAESAESLYYMAHALRRASYETGFLNDPVAFDNPVEVLMSKEYHAQLAEVLRRSRPTVDLTKHVELLSSKTALMAVGANHDPTRSIGSCEMSIVDRDGNWVQMMNTLQGGGIPGEVVGGVPMVGSTATSNLSGVLSGAWFTGGVRPRSCIGNTLVLRDGTPWLSLGTPGIPHVTVTQVLSSILDHGLDPYAADDAPRMMPLDDDYGVEMESRVAPSVAQDLARLGVLLKPMPKYYFSMGSFQMSWRDAEGRLHASAGPRRAGTAGGF